MTEQRMKILKERYFQAGESSFEDVCRRVVKSVCDQKFAQQIFELLTACDFLPNSPTLMNAGTPLGQLSACFVVPIEDSIDSILKALYDMAMIHKSGGGCGFSFSRLRPKGDRISTTGGKTTGAISFMTLFDKMSEVIHQGGKRPGANMFILDASHPEIEQFVSCKVREGELRNANISVGASDKFMQSVIDDDSWNLINPRNGEVVKVIKASELFDKIAYNAWNNGEPGIVFLDTINKYHPYGRIEATNPCGEQPLLPYESCNLGSINLSNHVKDDDIDWDKLRLTVELGVRFLDAVIDVNKFPLPEIEKVTKTYRKIGLGVMGFADLLLKMHIAYDSNEALDVADKLAKNIKQWALNTSVKLAEEKGPFPVCNITPKRRNATLLTIAPTGSLALIAGCSNGIEPVFDWIVERKFCVGEGTYVHPLARQYGDKLPSYFRRALDIHWMWHLKMQAKWQEYVDNAVSKTINLPESATVEDIKQIYLTAWKMGCKGVTVYRNLSRKQQVYSSAIQLPRRLKAERFEVKSGCTDVYVLPTIQDNKIREVFIATDGRGGCRPQTDCIAILLSMLLRSNVDVRLIIKQLKRIMCPTALEKTNKQVHSCPYAIGVCLEELTNELEGSKSNEPQRCIICNQETLISESGCVVCKSCGYVRCG